ncbi:MAG TPA: tRNA lysidine(34) synthetase TilS [Agriterribacter sp.]|mgnify:CR=1 FL=1|nr:tRNA lysidine(34) synthetase TilS [Agriterribacter sp.]
MNDLTLLFRKNIQNEKLFQPNSLLLLAVSGGVDSAVLCELCYLAGYPFVIAHCNFRLRGEESNRDEQFVRSLAQRYKARLFTRHFDTNAYVLQNNVSVQVAARELRYQWFEELAVHLHAETAHPVYIVTAHHADDNVETVLMNFFKGTGVAGLRGMLPKTGKLIRPLLFAGKQDIIAFAKASALDFVEDSSNASDKYTRNYIRHRVIPAIQEIYPAVRENINANIDRFRDIELLYAQAVAAHKKKLLEEKDGEVSIPVLPLSRVVPLKTMVFEIIKPYGFTAKQTRDVIALLDAATGKFILSPTHRILRHRNRLIISPLQPAGSQMILIEEGTTEVAFEGGKLHITTREINGAKAELPASAAIACLDSRQIKFPLILRKWKPGDYFYPLGMQKKKKLARFFIDGKLSLAEKERVWVVEMNKKIVWVVNKRIDDRFKVTPGTETMLRIGLVSAEI